MLGIIFQIATFMSSYLGQNFFWLAQFFQPVAWMFKNVFRSRVIRNTCRNILVGIAILFGIYGVVRLAKQYNDIEEYSRTNTWGDCRRARECDIGYVDDLDNVNGGGAIADDDADDLIYISKHMLADAVIKARCEEFVVGCRTSGHIKSTDQFLSKLLSLDTLYKTPSIIIALVAAILALSLTSWDIIEKGTIQNMIARQRHKHLQEHIMSGRAPPVR